MRRILLLLMIFLLFMPNAKGASTLADPSKVNQLISIIETPQLAPGEKGGFSLELLNPYTNNMTNVSLTASIYLYVSTDDDIPVDANWSWSEPYFEEAGKGNHEHIWSFPEIQPGALNQKNLTATVVTSFDAPHGGLLDQGSYFVRFQLEFDYQHSNGTTEHAVMRSRGYFTTEQWEFATRDPPVLNDPDYVGAINLTIDGILPDTSFGILEPFPDWVFYVLVIAAAVSVVFALLFYLEENPDKWPGLANRWIRFRGSMKQSKRISQEKKEEASSRKKV
jgi:hypothetical protein